MMRPDSCKMKDAHELVKALPLIDLKQDWDLMNITFPHRLWGIYKVTKKTSRWSVSHLMMLIKGKIPNGSYHRRFPVVLMVKLLIIRGIRLQTYSSFTKRQTTAFLIPHRLKMFLRQLQIIILPFFFPHRDRLQPKGKHSAEEDLRRRQVIFV